MYGKYQSHLFLISSHTLISSLVTLAEVGKGYNIFAGKDGSRGLGMSSLKPEDAVADYSTLDDKQLKVLDDWVCCFPSYALCVRLYFGC